MVSWSRSLASFEDKIYFEDRDVTSVSTADLVRAGAHIPDAVDRRAHGFQCHRVGRCDPSGRNCEEERHCVAFGGDVVFFTRLDFMKAWRQKSSSKQDRFGRIIPARLRKWSPILWPML